MISMTFKTTSFKYIASIRRLFISNCLEWVHFIDSWKFQEGRQSKDSEMCRIRYRRYLKNFIIMIITSASEAKSCFAVRKLIGSISMLFLLTKVSSTNYVKILLNMCQDIYRNLNTSFCSKTSAKQALWFNVWYNGHALDYLSRLVSSRWKRVA